MPDGTNPIPIIAAVIAAVAAICGAIATGYFSNKVAALSSTTQTEIANKSSETQTTVAKISQATQTTVANISQDTQTTVAKMSRETQQVVARLTTRLDLESNYDLALRDARIKAYTELWAYFDALAFYWREKDITPTTIAETSEKLRQWYYRTGGLFLSGESQKLFREFQEATDKYIRQQDLKADDPRWHKICDYLQQFSSHLRTSLCIDIGSREQSELEKGRSILDKQHDQLEEAATNAGASE